MGLVRTLGKEKNRMILASRKRRRTSSGLVIGSYMYWELYCETCVYWKNFRIVYFMFTVRLVNIVIRVA